MKAPHERRGAEGSMGGATESLASEPQEYTHLPDRCPGCGTDEGGAVPALLCGPDESGLEVNVLTALCPACIAAVEAEDFTPVKRALELILPLIESAELSGGVEA